MVNESGQLYTMEGVAAGLIMLVTAYIVISTTSIYTTGDTHITDMQLEQLGSDVLAMMDTKDTYSGESDLVRLVRTTNSTGFREIFLNYCNMRANLGDDDLKMNAFISYRDKDSDLVRSYALDDTDLSTGRENAVRVTRWVQLVGKPTATLGTPVPSDMDTRAQAVLVEVLLWRA
jgi:hypothetical protein